MRNKNLNAAGVEKDDEFYTQLPDIENELQHYKSHFKGKVIYCNCDDYSKSNFFKYFKDNFRELGLKKLIATCYENQERTLYFENAKIAQMAVYGGAETSVRHLEGDGNFLSAECIKLLKQADIVVTNPPFSLFREYVAQLMEYDKKFLIMGNLNAITYKETFELIRENKIWLGVNNGAKKFDKQGKIVNMGNVVWYTNFNYPQLHEDLWLEEKYDPAIYPKYDNYNAINVNKTKDIPVDYEGAMGVPITFLDKYNPDQFEILGLANSARWLNYECLTIINGKNFYNRIIIKRKKS